MTPLAVKRDSETQQNVLRELNWDPRVEETDVGVEVDEGVVTLSGTVSSWGKRHAAEEAAHRVRGVLDVANNIAIRLSGTPGRTDTELAHAVRNALVWNVFVPDKLVRSTVSDGVVTLEGEVDTAMEREDAELAVRNLAGVRRLINLIGIRAPRVDAARLRDTIEEALERRAEREAKRVRVEVHEGHVRVSGTARSWPDRQVVIGAVKGTPGVRSIEDHLINEPSF